MHRPGAALHGIAFSRRAWQRCAALRVSKPMEMKVMKKPTPAPLDVEERDLMEAYERAFDEGTLISHLTPRQQAALRAAARASLVDRE